MGRENAFLSRPSEKSRGRNRENGRTPDFGRGAGDERGEDAHDDADGEAAEGHGEEGGEAKQDLGGVQFAARGRDLGEGVHHVIKDDGDTV